MDPQHEEEHLALKDAYLEHLGGEHRLASEDLDPMTLRELSSTHEARHPQPASVIAVITTPA